MFGLMTPVEIAALARVEPKAPGSLEQIAHERRLFTAVAELERRYSAEQLTFAVRETLLGHGAKVGEMAVLNAEDNASGGYLVPESVLSASRRDEGEWGVARHFAKFQNLPVGGDYIVPIVNSSAVRIVNISVEGDDKPQRPMGDAPVGASRIYPEMFSLSVDATVQQVRFAPDWLETMLGAIGDGVLELEDRLLFSTAGLGGLSNRLGLVETLADPNRAGSVKVAGTGHTAPGSVDIADIEDTVKKLPSRAWPRAKWYMHPAVIAGIFHRLSEKAAFTGADGRRWIFGFEAIPTAAMPSDPQAGEIAALLGDVWRASIMGVRNYIGARLLTEGENTPKGGKTLIGFASIGAAHVDIGDTTNAGAMVALQLAET